MGLALLSSTRPLQLPWRRRRSVPARPPTAGGKKGIHTPQSHRLPYKEVTDHTILLLLSVTRCKSSALARLHDIAPVWGWSTSEGSRRHCRSYYVQTLATARKSNCLEHSFTRPNIENPCTPCSPVAIERTRCLCSLLSPAYPSGFALEEMILLVRNSARQPLGRSTRGHQRHQRGRQASVMRQSNLGFAALDLFPFHISKPNRCPLKVTGVSSDG